MEYAIKCYIINFLSKILLYLTSLSTSLSTVLSNTISNTLSISFHGDSFDFRDT